MKVLFGVRLSFAGHAVDGGLHRDLLLVYELIFEAIFAVLVLLLLGVIIRILLRIQRRLGERD